MRRGLTIVTFILGALAAAAGIATAVTSLVNFSLGKKYIDEWLKIIQGLKSNSITVKNCGDYSMKVSPHFFIYIIFLSTSNIVLYKIKEASSLIFKAANRFSQRCFILYKLISKGNTKIKNSDDLSPEFISHTLWE